MPRQPDGEGAVGGRMPRQPDGSHSPEGKMPRQPDGVGGESAVGGKMPRQPDGVGAAEGKRSSGGLQQGDHPAALGRGRDKGGEQRAPAAVQITPQTAVVPQQDRSGWTLRHQRDNGAELRVRATALPDGRQKLTAYQNFKDPETGRRTRLYHDGRRVEFGSNFVTRSAPGRPTLTSFDNGLREGYLPDRKPFFREKFTTRHDRHGHERRLIERTMFANYHSGRVVTYREPVVWTYEVVPVRQVEVYMYEPRHFQPTVYTLFTEPLYEPIEVTPSCILCPPPVVGYVETVEVYRNPLELLIDWLLAGAVDDGYTMMVSPSVEDPQVRELSSAVTSLRQELSELSANNDGLRRELADQRVQLDLLQADQDRGREVERIPMSVPEPVRKQFGKQVKQDLIAHQENRPLSLAQILASSKPKEYIFQVSETLEAVEVRSNDECSLTTGDLVAFDEVPEEGESAARIRVITSKATSCRVNSVVNVSLWDLQEMLNSYRQRLEANVERIGQEVGKGAKR
ncbi:MAG: hypothetical protein H7834_12400 [Magnetococcus sp. YQC-9]